MYAIRSYYGIGTALLTVGHLGHVGTAQLADLRQLIIQRLPLAGQAEVGTVFRLGNQRHDVVHVITSYSIHYTKLYDSTTGAGSEGALTKGPFNALRPTADLNNARNNFV